MFVSVSTSLFAVTVFVVVKLNVPVPVPVNVSALPSNVALIVQLSVDPTLPTVIVKSTVSPSHNLLS